MELDKPIDEAKCKDSVVDEMGFKSPDQLSSELITLSLLPQSRWKHLMSLEIIKVT